MKKSVLFVLLFSVALWAIVPSVALGAVQIPFSRPTSSNSGYIYLQNEDGSKWFSMTVQAVLNNTELDGSSSSGTTVSQQDSFSALEALAGGLYLQLELDATNNNIEALGMAYVDTNNLTTFHSGELINKERSDIIFIYQYASYDGTRVRQSYGYDPGKINSIIFSEGWRVNPVASGTSYMLYGEVGGNISLKVVRHRSSDNKYLGGPYATLFSIGSSAWTWRNEQLAVVGDVDAHIATTPSEHSQAQQIAQSISDSAESLHDLADSLDVTKPSVNGGVPADTPVQISIADNPALTAIASIWSNDIILTLSIVSLTMATIIILLRGTHG